MTNAAARPLVAVAVITYNDRAYLPECFGALARQEGVPGPVETILIDNASCDDSVALVRARYPGVRIIAHAENLGFCRALNHVAEQTQARYLAFLNPDTRVAPDWLAALLACAAAHQAACVGGKILSWDGQRIDFVGTRLNLSGYGVQEEYGTPADGRFIEDDEIFAPCGGAMLIEREVFLRLGGFDAALGAFYEDLDLGWRLRLAGYPVWFAARAVAYHHGSGTWRRAGFAVKQKLWGRNALRVMLTNLDEESFRRLFVPLVALALKRGLLSLSAAAGESGRDDWPLPGSSEHERWQQGMAQLQALDEVLSDLPALCIRRAAVQQTRTVSDGELFARFSLTPEFRGLFEHPDHDLQAARLIELFDLAPLLSPGAAAAYSESVVGRLDRERAHLRAGAVAAQQAVHAAGAVAADAAARAADAAARAGRLEEQLAAARAYTAGLQHDLDQHRAFVQRVRTSFPYRCYARLRRLLR